MKLKIVPSQQSVKGNTGNTAHKRLFAATGFSLCMIAPGFASAATVSIDDAFEAIFVNHDIPNATVIITQEAIGVIGQANIYFDFASTDTGKVPGLGQSITTNYNIWEPTATGQTELSDTLSITLMGLYPGKANNVGVYIFFRSDSLDGITPPPLLNASNIFEMPGYQVVDSGLGDLKVQFTSMVPVPAAAWLLGSGLLGLAGIGRRKIASKAA